MAVTAGLIAAGLVLCALYVQRQLTLPEPMLQVGISAYAQVRHSGRHYRHRAGGACAARASSTPLYIQGVPGFSATMSGVAHAAGARLSARSWVLCRGVCSTVSACAAW
ncbi:MAG: hypothetical protein ACLTDR_09460 [Adlercreutzia equolifaciens]